MGEVGEIIAHERNFISTIVTQRDDRRVNVKGKRGERAKSLMFNNRIHDQRH